MVTTGGLGPLARPVTTRSGRLSASASCSTSCNPPPCGSTLIVTACGPWSASGSGYFAARNNETLTPPPCTLWPYRPSFSTATPNDGSLMSTKRCAHTSNLAASQELLAWVGRRACPNWMSHAASLALTSSGTLNDSRFSSSFQSMSKCTSSRAEPARITYVCVSVERPNLRCTTSSARSGCLVLNSIDWHDEIGDPSERVHDSRSQAS